MNMRWLGGYLLLVLVSSAAFAADWDAYPFGSVGGNYESNLGLSPVRGQELSVTGAIAEAGIALRAATPKTITTFRPYLRSTYYPGERDADYNNAFADLNLNYSGQRSTAALFGEYSHEVVSSGALPGTDVRGDLGNPRDGTLNGLTTRSRRDVAGLYPSASFALTQRGSLEVAANLVDVRYDKKLPGEELGYRFLRGSAGWAYSVSPLSTLAVGGFTQQFKPEDAPGAVPSVGSTSYGATVRWSHARSAKQRFYVQGGATSTSFDRQITGSGVSGSKSGYLGGVGASWTLQTSTVFADVVHSVQPSSTGQVSDQTDARVQLLRIFSARWHGTLGARAIESKAVNPGAATDDRQYGIATVALEWRWTRRVFVTGDIEYIHQKLENQPAANTNRIIVSIGYDAGRRE